MIFRSSIGTVLVIGLIGQAAWSQDRGYRYQDGKCAGLNPGVLIQCGDLRE